MFYSTIRKSHLSWTRNRNRKHKGVSMSKEKVIEKFQTELRELIAKYFQGTYLHEIDLDNKGNPIQVTLKRV